MTRRSWLRAERDRLQETCTRIATTLELSDPFDLDHIVMQVWICKHDHDEMSKQLDRADELREQVSAFIDKWGSEAATLVQRNQKNREDRMYAQACRDHAADLARCLQQLESP